VTDAGLDRTALTLGARAPDAPRNNRLEAHRDNPPMADNDIRVSRSSFVARFVDVGAGSATAGEALFTQLDQSRDGWVDDRDTGRLPRSAPGLAPPETAMLRVARRFLRGDGGEEGTRAGWALVRAACRMGDPDAVRARVIAILGELRSAPYLYAQLPEHLRRDPGVARATLKGLPEFFFALPRELQARRDILFEAARGLGTRLIAGYAAQLTPELYADRDFGLALAAGDLRSAIAVGDRARAHSALRVLLERGGARPSRDLDLIRITARDAPGLLNLFDEQAIEQVPEARAAYTAEMREARRLGIEWIERFDAKTLAAVLQNRRALLDEGASAGDPRPLAVVIMSRYDYNSAFNNNTQRQALARIAATYRLVYFEPELDDALLRDWRRATSDGAHRAELTILAGHGEKDALTLSVPPPGRAGKAPEATRLDTSDAEQLLGARVERFVARDGQVILLSCSTGSGREAAPWGDAPAAKATANLANLISHAIPQATVWAPTDPGNITVWSFLASGRLESVEYTTPAGKPVTYRTRRT
jgi:hypothetical protein